MDLPFPFGYPLPTAFYLSLYVATLVIHVVFMNYVLAGSAYLAAFAVLHKRDANGNVPDPLALPLRDWLPFMLSAAITAGIAPLLFVQILYQRHFYTANLLLFHRWMAIVPVLIVGFYLLYLLKSRVVAKASLAWRIAVGCGAFLCFGFTAWSWTENHLLSLNEAIWPAQFGSGRLFYTNPELFPRLLVWFTGAFPTMATIVAWQHWYVMQREENKAGIVANLRCTSVALAGLAVAAVAALWYVFSLDSDVRALLVTPSARWYLAISVTGLAIQLAAWSAGRNDQTLRGRRLSLISVGLLMTITGTSVLREIRRLAAIDVTRLYDLHADAATVGGLAVFLVFAAINVGLIGWCLMIVRRGLRKQNSV